MLGGGETHGLDELVRRRIAMDFDAVWDKVDAIVTPSTPSAAFALGDKQIDPLQMYLNDIFTIAANLTGAPALSIPCGFDRNGLPIGLQLQGPAFSEAKLIDIAHRFQQATDWHKRIPAMAQA